MLLIILYQWLIYTSATLTELKLSVFRAAPACPCILTFCPIHQHFKNLTIGTESGVSKCWSYVHVCTCKHTVSKEFIFNFKDHTSTKTDILTIAKFNNAYTMWHSFRNYWEKLHNKRICIHKAIYLIVNTGIQQHSWPFAFHYTSPVLKIETWKILVEKAINQARLLVAPHLINAWIWKPLLKCHIYLTLHYSPDKLQAFKGFHAF